MDKLLIDKRMHSTPRRGLVTLALMGAVACGQQAPFRVEEGLFGSDCLSMAGIEEYPGAQTFSVFRAEEGKDLYANGAVLTKFQGRFYCMWQASERDEDTPDTHLFYAVSDDAEHWSPPMDLADAGCTSGGWWNAGDSLIAYVNVWPERLEPRGGEAWYRASVDGVEWSPMRPVRMADGRPLVGVLEQDPHRFGNRIVGAVHFQPGLQVCPIFTDSLDGVNGWQKATFEATPSKMQTRELEPSVFQRKDGALVMVFRDQERSFRKLAAVSHDRGETWSKAVETTFPDSRSKQCAGNLPDGTPFLIGNPGPGKDRSFLMLATASDGATFDEAWILRDNPPERRFEGKAKTLGYSYPKAYVDEDFLYVAYSVNKEEIAVTRLRWPIRSAMTTSSRP